MRSSRSIIILFIFAILLAACGPEGEQVDVSAISTDAVATVYAALTETVRARPTDTPTPTSTRTPTLTPYWTATPGPDFANARLISASVDFNGRTLIIIEIPGLSTDTTTIFRGTVSGVEYSCAQQADYPDTLFCSGPIRGPYIIDDFLLFVGQGKEPVFQVSFYVQPTPTQGLPRFENNSLCEVEPLYQPFRPELTWAQDPSKAGCYAITCYYPDGTRKCGTQDTCIAWPADPCP